jgi:hypothetical protein
MTMEMAQKADQLAAFFKHRPLQVLFAHAQPQGKKMIVNIARTSLRRNCTGQGENPGEGKWSGIP